LSRGTRNWLRQAAWSPLPALKARREGEAVKRCRGRRISETPATALAQARMRRGVHRAPLRLRGATGCATHSARVLGLDPFAVVKTLDHARRTRCAAGGADARQPHRVSTKNLARQIGAKSVAPCKPEVAQPPQWLLCGRYIAFWLKRRACRCMWKPRVLALPRHLDQRRAARVPGGHPPRRCCLDVLGAQAGAVRAAAQNSRKLLRRTHSHQSVSCTR
jgi:hypothetical protein